MAASSISPAAYALALRGYSPVVQAAVARSKYLEDALREPLPGNMQSGGELAARLAAVALNRYGEGKANKSLADALKADADSKWQGMAAVLGGAPSADAAPPSQAPTPPEPPQAGAPPAPQLPPAAQVTPSSSGPQLDAKKRDTLVRLLIGEEPTDDGQRGVASVVLNRASRGGMDPMDVVAQKGQFEPYGNPKRWAKLLSLSPGDPAYKQAAGNLDAVLQSGPTTDADHFYAPKAQAALGRPMPSWDNGSGQDIGQSRFLNLGFQAPAGYQRPAQAAPDMGVDAAAAAPQQQPPPQQPVSAPPAPMPPTGAAGRAIVTPEEISTLQAWMQSGDPELQQAAQQKFQQLMWAMAARPEYSASTNDQGQAVYTPKTPGIGQPYVQDIPGYRGPNEVKVTDQGQVVRAPKGGGPATAEDIPGYRPSLPPGMTYDQNTPPAHQIPGTGATAPFKIPGAQGLFIMGPDGTPKKVADETFTTNDVLAMRDKAQNSEAFKNAQEAKAAFSAMVQSAQHTGGMFTYSMLDTFARAINPGAVARVGTIQAIKDSQGIPDRLKAQILSLTEHGQGLTPEVTQQLLDATQGFVNSRYQALSDLNKSNADFVKAHGGNPADVVLDLGAVPTAPRLGGQPQRLSPQDAAKLAPGTQFYGQDGVLRTRK